MKIMTKIVVAVLLMAAALPACKGRGAAWLEAQAQAAQSQPK